MLKRKCTSNQKQHSEETAHLLQECVKFCEVARTWTRKTKTGKVNSQEEASIKLAEFYIEELNKYKQLFSSQGCTSGQIEDNIDCLLKDLNKMVERAKPQESVKVFHSKDKITTQYLKGSSDLYFESFNKNLLTQSGETQEMDIPLTNDNFITQNDENGEQNTILKNVDIQDQYMAQRFGMEETQQLSITEIENSNDSVFTLGDIPLTNDNFMSQNKERIKNNSISQNYEEELEKFIKIYKDARTWIKNAKAGKINCQDETSIKLAEFYIEQLNKCKQLFSSNEIDCLLEDLKKVIKCAKPRQKLNKVLSSQDSMTIQYLQSSQMNFPSFSSANFTDRDLFTQTDEIPEIVYHSDIPLTNTNFITQDNEDEEISNTIEKQKAEEVEYRFLNDLNISDNEEQNGENSPICEETVRADTPSPPLYQSIPFSIVVTHQLDADIGESRNIQHSRYQGGPIISELYEDTLLPLDNNDEMQNMSPMQSSSNDHIYENTEELRFEREAASRTEKLLELWSRVQQENNTLTDKECTTLDRSLKFIDTSVSRIVKDLDKLFVEKQKSNQQKSSTESKKRVNPFKWPTDSKASMAKVQISKKVKIDEDANIPSKQRYLPNIGFENHVLEEERCPAEAMQVNWENLMDDPITCVDDEDD